MTGLFGAGATRSADVNLLIQLIMAVALTAGMFLARAKRYRAHAWTQSAVLVLNLAAIGSVMMPSFHRQVLSHVPSGWRDPYYALATIHAALGAVAEALGLYVVLVAGTSVLPPRLRFRNYKLWMRTTLSLWWTVVVLGLGVYYVWYLQPSPGGARGPAAGAQPAAVTIILTNFQFDPPQVTVPAGTTVEWVDNRGRHAIVADQGAFQSPVLLAGSRFRQTFQTRGVFDYYCRFHGEPGRKDMAGTIIVK